MKKEMKMLLGFVGAFVGFEIVMSIKGDVESEYVDSVKQFVDGQHSNKDRELLAEADRIMDLAEERLAYEKEEVNHKLDEFKKSINYVPEKKKALKEAKESVDEFKKSINFDSEIKEIDESLKEKLDSYKKSVDYDRTIESIKEQIQEVKDDYEHKKLTYKVFTDEETAKELKKAAKKARNKAIEEYEKEIGDMEEKFATIEKEATEKAQKAKQELSDKVGDVKVKANRKAQERIDSLDNMVAVTRDSIEKGVVAGRSKEDKEIFKASETLRIAKRELETKDNELKVKMLKGAKFDDKLALYLHQRSVKSWMVKVIGYVPGCVGFGIAVKCLIKYIEKVNSFAVKVEVGGVAI